MEKWLIEKSMLGNLQYMTIHQISKNSTIVISAIKAFKVWDFMFSGLQISNLMSFFRWGPLEVSDRDSEIFWIRKISMVADYWLSAAPHLKNNIKFEIYDPENIKSLFF